jgi:NDP-sugar pyrophosphorylase family protein
MKKIILLSFIFLTGCTLGLKAPDAFSNSPTTDIGKKAVAVVKAEDSQKQVDQLAEANKKVEAARQEMELKYNVAREQLQKSYDDLKKKDDDNFAKIGELNYGIYMVTQEKKKQDMNTLVAHLRAKEILNRTDKLTPEQKAAITAEISKEKALTIDQLYTKYNGAVELAVVQKQALDNAQTVIDQQEKEKAALREAEKITLNKLQAERNAEIDRIKKDAADQLAMAKAAQKAELVALMVKSLIGVGILFLVLAILLKNITMGIGAILSLGLAYVAATVEMWVVGASLGGIILLAVVIEVLKSKKKAPKVAAPTQ